MLFIIMLSIGYLTGGVSSALSSQPRSNCLFLQLRTDFGTAFPKWHLNKALIIRNLIKVRPHPGCATSSVNLKEALILCDIEGSEFDVLTSKVLCDLEGITLVVELHDRLMPENLSLRQDLIARLPEKAKHEILKSTPANWQGIPEIEAMTDYDLALIAIDGRKILGEWLLVTYPD